MKISKSKSALGVLLAAGVAVFFIFSYAAYDSFKAYERTQNGSTV